MNFHGKNPEEDVSINLTPLIDVVFLLLIFFMVSTTFDTTSQLKIRLPEASRSQVAQPPQKVTLLIDAKGNFYVNSRELTNRKSATLKAALERSMTDGKLPIVIQSDAAVAGAITGNGNGCRRTAGLAAGVDRHHAPHRVIDHLPLSRS